MRRKCFTLLLLIVIYNAHQDLLQSLTSTRAVNQAPARQSASGRISSSQTVLLAHAKGVAGLGKAGGDGQGGSDKAGQQVPPEVYKALTYAGSLFLLTLSVPLILYGLNKLLNKIEECFGCGPSSAKAKMMAKQNESSNGKRATDNGANSRTVQDGQQPASKRLHENQRLHLQLMHQQPKCYNFTPLNEFDDRQISHSQSHAHEPELNQPSPLVQANSFPISMPVDIDPASTALNNAPGMARKTTTSPSNEPLGAKSLPFSQQHQPPYIISSPRL